LHIERALPQHPLCGLACYGERLRKQVVQRFALTVTTTELLGLGLQLGVAEAGHIVFEGVDVVGDTAQPLHHLALSRTKQAAQNHPVDLTRCVTARDASLSVQRATSNSRPGTGRTSPILEKPGPDVHMTRAICQARRPRTPRARHIALS